MRYSFQMIISGTIDTGEDNAVAGVIAAQKVSNAMNHIPALMGSEGLELDTMTSGIKAAPSMQQYDRMMEAVGNIPSVPHQ